MIEGLLKDVPWAAARLAHSLVWCCREVVLKEMTPELGLEGRIGTSRITRKFQADWQVPRCRGMKKPGLLQKSSAASTAALERKMEKGGSQVLGKPAGPGLVVRWIS